MKRIFTTVSVLLLASLSGWANINSCVAGSGTNCTVATGDPFVISMIEPTNTWSNICVNESVIVVATPTTNLAGLEDITETNEWCCVTDIIVPLPTNSIISNRWVAQGPPNTYTIFGNGLTASFAPMAPGPGTLVFYLDYSNSCGAWAISTTNTYMAWGLPTNIAGPQPGTVCPGSNIVLNAVPTPSNSVAYQWQFNGVNLSDGTNLIDGSIMVGSDTSNLTIVNFQTNEQGIYTVQVSNDYYTEISASTNVFLGPDPEIIFDYTNGIDAFGYNGDSWVSSINMEGDIVLPPLLAYWGGGAVPQQLGPIPGELDAVTNAGNEQYQWLLNGSPIAGATNSFFRPLIDYGTTGCIQLEETSCETRISPPMTFQCLVSFYSPSNVMAFIGSSFESPPLIPWIPAIKTFDSNAPLILTLNPRLSPDAAGNELYFPITYQWRLNGNPIDGATGSIVSLDAPSTSYDPCAQTCSFSDCAGYFSPQAQLTNAGVYDCLLSNLYGAVISAPVQIIVTTNLANTNGYSPQITNQPASIELCPGWKGFFAVSVSGCAPLTYQWNLDGTNVGGETNASYGIVATTNQGTNYVFVTVTNSYGAVTSTVAALIITNAACVPQTQFANEPGSAPGISSQPTNQTGCIGEPVSFTVEPSGAPPFYYQWMFNGTNIPGAYGNSYSPSSVASSGGAYAVIISNSFGCITSQVATLTLSNCEQLPPIILASPSNQTVCIGEQLNLNVQASGSQQLYFQWYANGSAVAGGTGSALRIAPYWDTNVETYTVTVTNEYGSASAAAVVAKSALPTTIYINASNTVYLTNTITFSADLTSALGLFGYQWFFDGNAIFGATNSTYDIPAAAYSNAGLYSVMVSNACGTMTSTNLAVQVRPPASTPPFINGQPPNQVVCSGSPVSLAVLANGTSPLSYQWMFNGTNIPSATQSVYTLDVAGTNAGTYTVLVTNEYGSITSSNAVLTVSDPTVLSICQPPTNLSLYAGANAMFQVAQCGACPISYQWFKTGYGNLISGAGNVLGGESDTLQLLNVSSNDAGSYSVILSNSYSCITSSIVTLSVVYTDTPPTISYINPIKCSTENGSFQIPFGSVLSASDAQDSDGVPVSFIVDSVTNGQLIINGVPFSPPGSVSPNCTFNLNSILQWTAVSNVPNTGEPVLTLSAFDGYKTSTNTAALTIIPLPPTFLLGWAYNCYGALGNGEYYQISPSIVISNGVKYNDILTAPISDGIHVVPDQVKITGHAREVRSDDFSTGAAVTTTGGLWMWGSTGDFPDKEDCRFGDGNYIIPSFSVSPGPDAEYLGCGYPTPIVVQMLGNDGVLHPFTNVVDISLTANVVLALLSDGTLWSWGGSFIQSEPLGYDNYAASPHAQQVVGMNDGSGNPLKIKQAIADIWGNSAIALGADGSVWWWGVMNPVVAVETNWDTYTGQIDGLTPLYGSYNLTGASDSSLPSRLTAFDTGPSVIQVALCQDHCMALRSDGSVWEFGFVPSLSWATSVTTNPACYLNGYEHTICEYTSTPIEVTGIPTNIISIAACDRSSHALTADGIVYEWGLVQPGSAPYQLMTVNNTGLSNIVEIDGGFHSLQAIDSLGHVWEAGNGAYGEFGYIPPAGEGGYVGSGQYEYVWPTGDWESDSMSRNPFIENAITGTASYLPEFCVGSVETGRPTGVIATASNESVLISWEQYSGASSYTVYRSGQSGGPYLDVGSTTSNSFVDVGLTNGTASYYVVAALSMGAETPYSDEVSATPYSPPSTNGWIPWNPSYSSGTNVGVLTYCRDIQLYWETNSSATFYQLYRSTSPTNAFTLIAQTTSLSNIDSTAQGGNSYYYYIVAGNAAGYSQPSITNGPIQLDSSSCAPSPVITSLTNIADGVIQVSWQYPDDATNGLDGFYVEWYFFGPDNLNKQPPGPTTSFIFDYISLSDPNLSTSGSNYSYIWTNAEETIPDLQLWFKVAADVGGQEGTDSGIAGPVLDCATCESDASLQLQAFPGDSQVYLQWQAATNATVYDVQYNNDGGTNWLSAATNISDSRFWHTNLSNGITYYYQIISETIFNYTNDGIIVYVASPPSPMVSATPETNYAPKTNVTFTLEAYGYDGMVYLQWGSLGDPPQYQSFVERKLQTDPDSAYITMSVTGYGLSFIDSSVADGTTYTYRVTAFDTNYNRFQATATATPSATGNLGVIATPGNGFVNLMWNPISASYYIVEHGLQSGGPYTPIASVPGTSFLHYPVQNGATQYYVIEAVSTYNTTVNSPQVSATPLATLANMPPTNFTATIGNGIIELAWSPVANTSSYLLSQFLPPDSELTNQASTSYVFAVPTNTADGTSFRFDLMDINAAGMYSTPTSVTVVYTNLTDGDPGGTSELALSVGNYTLTNSGVWITNTGPTNLVLTASVKATNGYGGQVYFYDYDTVIGTAQGPIAQMTWYNVPGGEHQLTAQVITTPNVNSISQFFGITGNSETYNSAYCYLYMIVAPPLEAYRASATDLQLPAPGFPITLSRSYSSQVTNSPGYLGIGWTASWNNSASLQIADGNMADDWIEAGWDGIGINYYAAETKSHLITITLPGGSTVYFAPVLNADEGDPSDAGPITLSFSSFAPNQGSLTCSAQGAQISSVYSSQQDDDWGGEAFQLESDPDGDSLDVDGFTYTTASGTQYQFGIYGSTWNLTQVVDPNGNSLTYYYTNNTFLSEIAHSDGREVQFTYQTNTSPNGTWIDVFDTISATQTSGAYPVIKYFVQGNPTNGLLTEVDKLTDRVNGIYEQTTYSYGINTNCDYNRLTQTFDGRGILTVSNQYSLANDGTLANQYDALLHASTYTLSSGVQEVTRTVGGSNQTSTVNYSPSGAISQVLQPINESGYTGTSYSYDSSGNLISQTDSYGATQTTAYDSLNRPVGQSDALGNSTSTQLNSFGQPTLSTDANGNNTTNTYDNNGNLTEAQDPTGTLSQTTYTALMNNSGGVMAAGLVASSSQQAPGMAFTVNTAYTYYQNNAGLPTGNLTGEIASVTQQWVNSSGSPSGPAASSTYYQYDANGNRVQQTQIATVNGVSGTSITTQYQYDGENRLIATIDPLGRTSSTVYDKAGRPYITTNVENQSTTNTYDAIGNLIETAYPDGTVSRMTYDELNHVLYTQDRSVPSSGGSTTNAATLNVYDGAGRVVCVERLSGVILTRQVNSSVITRSGADTIYQMTNTSAGTLVSFTRSVYDLDGRVMYSMAANGTVTEYDYDADGRRISALVYTNYTVDLSSIGTTIDPTGGYTLTQYQYDPNGNQIAMIDANANETDYQYDTANRVVLTTYPQVTGATSRTQTAIAYDGLGNKVRTIDEAGVPTAYTYDYRGLLTSVTLDAGSQSQLVYTYAYDEMGNLTKQIDARGNVTQFQYDALGRRTQRLLPDGSMETTVYSDVPASSGSSVNVEQTAVTDFQGKTIVSTEDVMNRLATKVLPAINPGDAVTTETYSYTPGGQLSQVQTSTNAGGSGSVAIREVYYYYDNLNRLTNKNTPEGDLSYAWTPDNHVQSIQAYNVRDTDTNGNVRSGAIPEVNVGYGYDYLGRLASVTNSYRGPTTYAYDKVGNLASVQTAGGPSHTYSYNAENRLVAMLVGRESISQTWTYNYGLNAAGQRISVTESNIGSVTQTLARSVAYEYDGNYSGGSAPARVYRLTRETITNSSGAWAGAVTNIYDLVGNRTTRQVGFGFTPEDSITNQSFTFDHRDLIDSDSVPNNFNTNYDANGNTLVDNGTNTGDLYDAENRLVARGSGIEITYDADGNRVSKTVDGATTYYLVDDQNPTGYPQVIAEYSPTTQPPIATYAWGLNLISETNSDGDLLFCCYDGAGSVRKLMESVTVQTYDYDAYGNLLAESGGNENEYLYVGQQWDSDLGMYYNRARYYDPKLGRFWTMDTSEGTQEDPLSLHKYLYCQANPLNGTDLSGNDDLASLSISESISASMDSSYNGVVTTAGNAMMATLSGVQQQQNLEQVLTGYYLGTALGVVAGYAIGQGLNIADELIYGEEAAAGAMHIGGVSGSVGSGAVSVAFNDVGPEACVPAVTGWVMSLKDGSKLYTASMIEQRLGQSFTSSADAIPTISAANQVIMKAGKALRLSTSLGQVMVRDWSQLSTSEDGVFVVYFTGRSTGKHVVGGVVQGGRKWLYDAGGNGNIVTLEQMKAQWGPVTGIYQVH